MLIIYLENVHAIKKRVHRFKIICVYFTQKDMEKLKPIMRSENKKKCSKRQKYGQI